jgi:hypothetical protein
MASTRTLITLPAEDKRWLIDYSRAHGISIAEAVRRGIHNLKLRERQNLYAALLKRTRGLWQKGDGLKYQRTIRAEWHES